MHIDALEHSNQHIDALEQTENDYFERQEELRYGWLEAVTKSPKRSPLDFGANTSVEIFNETLCYNDFDKEVARLLINGYNSGNVNITEVYKLFDDMASEYSKTKI